MKVYASLLRNKLIPENEINEANLLLAQLLAYNVDELGHMQLKEAGYGQAMEEFLFSKDPLQPMSYQFYNDKSDLILSYVKHYPLNEAVTKNLHAQFDTLHNHSYFLKNGLLSLFSAVPLKKEEFLKELVKLDLALPRHLDPGFDI